MSTSMEVTAVMLTHWLVCIGTGQVIFIHHINIELHEKTNRENTVFPSARSSQNRFEP